jgi:hypothetical protein
MLPTPQDFFAIATTNVGHLSRFVGADLWQKIKASSVKPNIVLG